MQSLKAMSLAISQGCLSLNLGDISALGIFYIYIAIFLWQKMF